MIKKINTVNIFSLLFFSMKTSKNNKLISNKQKITCFINESSVYSNELRIPYIGAHMHQIFNAKIKKKCL